MRTRQLCAGRTSVSTPLKALKRSERIWSGGIGAPAPRKRLRGPRRVKRRDAEATRRRILQAALREFAAKGLDAARIEDIAEAAGANRRMAYYYFGSKEGLYLAALEAAYFELVEVEEAIDVEALEPIDAI